MAQTAVAMAGLSHPPAKLLLPSWRHGGTSTLQHSGPPRITMRVASRNAYICRDCGYIYSDRKPFDKLPDSYFCPVCGAPKRRFKPYDNPVAKNSNDTKVRKARKQEIQKADALGAALPVGVALGLVALLGTYIYLNRQF